MKTLLSLVGTKWRGDEIIKLVASLPAGESLLLVRDPGNEFDANAIKVFARGQHIGFVKGSEAAYLAPRMDQRPLMIASARLGSGRAPLPGKLIFDFTQWPLIEIEEPV